MSASFSKRLSWLGVAGLIAFAPVIAGCSDDSDDDGAEAATPEDPWCASVRAGQNLVTSQRTANLREQAELAPEELSEAYEVALEFLEYAAENPSDILGIAERREESTPALAEILRAAHDDCGITVKLG